MKQSQVYVQINYFLNETISSSQQDSLPCKVGGQFFGHVDDVLLRAELVMVGEDVLEVDLVLVEQGLHPRSIVAGKSDAQRRKDIRHNLEMKWSKN